MKIALINGSPKINNSASRYLLSEIKNLIKDIRRDLNETFDKNFEIKEFNIHKPEIDEKELKQLYQCNILIFAFPLYVDSIPSHLLNVLTILENYYSLNGGKNTIVYTLVNSGFYEGNQNKIAIEIMQNWTYKSRLTWGQGIGIGSGGMLLSLTNIPSGRGPKKNLSRALESFTKEILSNQSETIPTSNKTTDNLYINMNIPRFAYIQAAHFGFRMSAKENGLKRRDLFKRM
ncbi:NAD(P)H-dependent oxidoreductase [Anaerocolumna sp. MB42-C2]|uniref:NAD(P)H-dependent oxidoreductase n=1 Tax=Anaerocolumna sp. MB42-C2 TaxID=3070997 RepID=UPI0027E136F2|nr:NAD(P)H-dependent oxidoreductase [Anaerocolumna sp. MB42-C2]WMJ88156.1 NAD(P)H-dependent oxidoreductase [Anaerocolumna sp. MB42-C2]